MGTRRALFVQSQAGLLCCEPGKHQQVQEGRELMSAVSEQVPSLSPRGLWEEVLNVPQP